MKRKVLLLANVILVIISILGIYNVSKKIGYEKNYYIQISSNEFKKEIKKDNLLVYFYKKDCNACSLLKKDLNNIIKKDKLTVYAVDIMKNDNDEILYNYVDIKYTPTIIRFQKSKEVKRIEGNNGYKKTYEFLINKKIKQEG